MATIVQNYGPIYGEVVNGTVQGRPNGSVFVPISNIVDIMDRGASTIELFNDNTYRTNVMVGAVAVSQDLSSYLSYCLYSDSALTTEVGSPVILPGGYFNDPYRFTISTGSDALTPGDTYYLVAKLMNNAVPIAVSDVVELEAV